MSTSLSLPVSLTGAEIVVKTLIAHSVDTLFGFPGGAVLNLYDALYRHSDNITHILTCHEQGAAHAADGYARASGKTGVVLATSGPGATNLVTGLATAYLDSTPLVALTGNVALPLIGKDSFQEVDIAGITMPITKHNYIVQRIDELEDILQEAFQIAASGRPGPVLVDIPRDIQTAQAVFRGGKPLPLAPPKSVRREDVQTAAKLINASKRPYLYVGGGVLAAHAEDLVAKLADTIDAWIGCSMMGLSAVSSANPRKLGMTGMHGILQASRLKAEADLIIGLGVRFSDRATGDKLKYQENAKIIHIDIDESELSKNIQNVTEVQGDIRAVLEQLLPLCTAAVRQDAAVRTDECDRGIHSPVTPRPPTTDRPSPPVTAGDCTAWSPTQRMSSNDLCSARIISAVRARASDDTPIATDVGQHQMWTAQFYPFTGSRTFITSGGLGTMGFGLGAAIGASIAKGRKKVVLFTGDGSFHMNLQELATAVMHNIPVVVVVMNNNVLGMVRQWQGLFYDGRYAQTTMNRATDYVKLAEAFGAVGFRAADSAELDTALDAAWAADGPVVVECLIDRDEKVLPMIPPGGSIADIITE